MLFQAVFLGLVCVCVSSLGERRQPAVLLTGTCCKGSLSMNLATISNVVWPHPVRVGWPHRPRRPASFCVSKSRPMSRTSSGILSVAWARMQKLQKKRGRIKFTRIKPMTPWSPMHCDGKALDEQITTDRAQGLSAHLQAAKTLAPSVWQSRTQVQALGGQ